MRRLKFEFLLLTKVFLGCKMAFESTYIEVELTPVEAGREGQKWMF